MAACYILKNSQVSNNQSSWCEAPIHSQNQHEAQLYRTLLRKAHGDHAIVVRLLHYEGRIAPSASRMERLQRAIELWESDLNRWR